MQPAKPTKPTRRRILPRLSPRTASTQQVGPSGGFLNNLRLVWKIALIVLVMALGASAIVLAGLAGLQAMRADLDNLYSGMLLRLSNVHKAEIYYADLLRYLEIARKPQADIGERRSAMELAMRAISNADEIIDRYNQEWVTGSNYDYITRLLRARGKESLQESELNAVTTLNERYLDARNQFDAFYQSVEAGKPDLKLAEEVIYQYTTLRGHLRELINVNDALAFEINNAALARSGEALRTMLVTLVVATLLTLLMVFWITRATTRRLAALERGAVDLREGKLDTVVKVSGRDEIGTLGSVFNDAVTQLRAKAEADAEAMRQSQILQQNIAEFLNVTMDIAQGDLTKRGVVTEDVLGNVVDAVNLTVEEIAYLLKDVAKVAERVNAEAERLNQVAASVLEGAKVQADEAQKAQGQALEVTQSIRQMSDTLSISAQAAAKTLEASQKGQEALTATLTGMQSIRREVQSIAKSIKGLSDRSLEISEIALTISNIAKQTNLLALNAAIEAAGAGEAGMRFSVVADEVRKLAESSAQAAQRVGTLIKGIQSEIQGVVISVEGGTKEVEQGYRIATEASEQLKEIAHLAEQSSKLVQAISGVAQQQVQNVERVSQAVRSIAGTAEATEENSQQGRQAAEELRRLAEQLSANLSRFRLPS
ncbi:methyl-accepting chemotaxis protein [Calidithermus roseus]|uniref:Putative methyl-accepting chemotaxis protein YoaH n=1 Tax=Calidithermus roseus TaxID=1644118 RepID=A0A399ETM9_9DEIN|nr:methyl-accepting chemotaxis protein [Calidithermus roseus]RIH86933.1 putative methyl-accepting chemotaxis protein YoaH [Calidithermus roseus]